jgi:hypothetical protein
MWQPSYDLHWVRTGCAIGPQSASWMRDEDALMCCNPACSGAPFGLLRRRHHCRACGRIFCGLCCPISTPRFVAPSALPALLDNETRVCTLCCPNTEGQSEPGGEPTFVAADATRISVSDSRAAERWQCLARGDNEGAIKEDVPGYCRIGSTLAVRILQKHWESGLPSGVFGEFVFTDELDEESTARLPDGEKSSAHRFKQSWLDSQAPTTSIIKGEGFRSPPGSFDTTKTCILAEFLLGAPLLKRLQYYYKRAYTNLIASKFGEKKEELAFLANEHARTRTNKNIKRKLEREIENLQKQIEKWSVENIANLAEEYEQTETQLNKQLKAQFGVNLSSRAMHEKFGKLAWKSVQCFSNGQHVTFPSPSGTL